jgi:chorismate mutase
MQSQESKSTVNMNREQALRMLTFAANSNQEVSEDASQLLSELVDNKSLSYEEVVNSLDQTTVNTLKMDARNHLKDVRDRMGSDSPVVLSSLQDCCIFAWHEIVVKGSGNWPKGQIPTFADGVTLVFKGAYVEGEVPYPKSLIEHMRRACVKGRIESANKEPSKTRKSHTWWINKYCVAAYLDTFLCDYASKYKGDATPLLKDNLLAPSMFDQTTVNFVKDKNGKLEMVEEVVEAKKGNTKRGLVEFNLEAVTKPVGSLFRKAVDGASSTAKNLANGTRNAVCKPLEAIVNTIKPKE